MGYGFKDGGDHFTAEGDPKDYWYKIADLRSKEINRLRKAIYTAPHSMGCKSLQGGPTLPNWGKLEICDCWKKDALKETS